MITHGFTLRPISGILSWYSIWWYLSLGHNYRFLLQTSVASTLPHALLLNEMKSWVLAWLGMEGVRKTFIDASNTLRIFPEQWACWPERIHNLGSSALDSRLAIFYLAIWYRSLVSPVDSQREALHSALSQKMQILVQKWVVPGVSQYSKLWDSILMV